MGEIRNADICGAWVNPLDDLLGYHLRRASIAMMADLGDRLSRLNLTLTEVSVLQLIDANPLITQSEIGRLISIKRANMAPLAGGLISRGLVEREAMDGRSQGLRLTQTGKAIVDTARGHMAANEALFLGRIPRAQRSNVLGALKRLWAAGE
jgi:DNA-binding MarR family transcriptional regulator